MPKVKLGDVAREYKETCKGSKEGLPIVGLEHLMPEEITLTMWDEEKENTFTKLFHKGQVLFGRRRAYLKKAAVAPFDGICSGDITVIEAIHDKILPELLPFIIQNDTLFNYAIGKSAGSLSPRVKWEYLKNFEFDLPDIEEQKKLAELLWAANDTKKAYKKLLALTDELVKAQFIEMFGDPVTNPMGWQVMKIKDASLRLSDGPFGSNLKSEHYSSEGVRVIRLQNIGVGIFNDDDKAFVSDEHYQKIKKYTCKSGDIVIGTLGDPNLRACVIPDNIDVAINKADCVHCVPKSDILNNVFVSHYINYPSTITLAQGSIHGNTRQRISSGQVAQLQIFLPHINLQNQFADFVQQTDKSKFELQQTIVSLESTVKSLMKQYIG